MRKIFAALAAILVALGLTACSEDPYRDRESVAPVVPSPVAPSPAPSLPGPDLSGLTDLGGLSADDLLELQRQFEELGIDPNDPSSWGLSGTDLQDLERQLQELEDLMGGSSSGSSGSDSTFGGSMFSDANSYGDDPELDALWDDCAAGDMQACDDLYMNSPFDSEYEDFANNCGNAGNPTGGFCN